MNSTKQKDIQNKFYKFCTTVLKNEICDVYREKSKNHIVTLPIEYVRSIQTNDEYFTNDNVFSVNGYIVKIYNNHLAEAIRQLPQDKQYIILLAYFIGMTDVEIGKRLNTIQQTIFKRRKSALKLLQQILSKEIM